MTLKTTDILAVLLFILAFAAGSTATAEEQPNLLIEDRFHQIFKEFNEQPTSEESWNRVFRASQPRTYEVMEQDNLWDISNILFGDPFFWPKIWSFNADILNPHEIEPGWLIRFFPGTLEAPPSLVVTEFEGLELPDPKPPKPIAEVPPSLPAYVPEVPNFKPPEIVKPDRLALTIIPPLPLPVEIVASRPQYSGQVVEIEDGARMVADTRDIFVRLDVENSTGVYTVVKSSNNIPGAHVVQYRAEISVKERINDRENIYRATIIRTVDSVEVGDSIISGTIPMVDVSEVPVQGSAPLLRIVGGYRSPTDSLFSPYSIVFLNGGATSGLREGDALNLYQNPRLRVSDSKVVKAYREIGTIKIIRVHEDVSTGYILRSKSEIRVGDLAGVLHSDSGSGQSGASDDGELTLD